MADLNWRRIFGISSLVFALLLVCGSIYLHLKQKTHLGRLRHEDKVVSIGGVDAAPEIAIPLPVTINDERIQAEIENLLNQSYQQTSEDYSSEELDYSYDAVSSESIYPLNYTIMNQNLQELIASTFIKDFQEVPPTTISPQSDIEVHAAGMSETCLRCICETATDCKPSMCSDGKPCGYFRISVPYWIDAGSLLLEDYRNIENETTDFKESGYRQCVTNIFCEARTVYAYVDRYARDCNQDGIIDCRDHIALHMLGPAGCLRNEVLSPFYERMERCLND